MATSLANLNGPSSQIFSPLPLRHREPQKNPKFITRCSQASPRTRLDTPTISRRASIGLATAATLFNQLLPLHAEEAANNGWWLTGPLPVPTVTNKIANEETGTRSFLRKGIYIANIGVEGSAFRTKHNAFDLLALGDLLGKDAWNYMRKYLCLKSTIMYYDFDKIISAASDDQKPPLLQLANRLFDSIEKLDDAVKKKSDPLARSCYDDTTVILKEVMGRMTA